MIYQQDWVMRQVEMLVQFLARTIFHKDSISYEIADDANLSQTDLLYRKIMNLVKERRICEAENMIYDNLDENNRDYLKLALNFYQTINRMTDDELEHCNFSHAEIKDGVKSILHKYNISDFDNDWIQKSLI